MAEVKKISPFQVLRAKFPANEYVLIQEVSDASGFSRSRSLDYMLINLWQSRGLAVTGIEQKSWRNDWLKEIKNPAKQENHFKYCDYFYLLTTDENVAKIEEIPINWGWWHINKSGVLKTMKAAPKLNPEPIGRSLMCAMMRRAASKENYVHRDSIQEAIDNAVELGLKNRNSERDWELRNAKELRVQVELFEKESGIDIRNGWYHYYGKKNAGTIGSIVRILLDGGVTGYQNRMIKLKESAATILQHITEELAAMEKMPEQISELENKIGE